MLNEPIKTDGKGEWAVGSGVRQNATKQQSLAAGESGLTRVADLPAESGSLEWGATAEVSHKGVALENAAPSGNGE